jgi:hypothetical protein
VRDDLGVELARALEDAEHGRRALRASAAFAADVTCAEQALVDFDNAKEGALRLTSSQDASAQDGSREHAFSPFERKMKGTPS